MALKPPRLIDTDTFFGGNGSPPFCAAPGSALSAPSFDPLRVGEGSFEFGS